MFLGTAGRHAAVRLEITERKMQGGWGSLIRNLLGKLLK
jgi:DNA gyrase inhibitor GyrI